MGMMSLAEYNKAKEIDVFECNLNAVCESYAEILEAQREVGGMITYRAKVPSGGGKSFNIVTGDDDTDFSVPTFCGVIVYNHACNAYFDEGIEDNSPPVCSSLDGKMGIDTSCGECFSCKSCARNVFGSAANGRGKACKNMHRLYIMTEEMPIPLLLSLPPTSLQVFQAYRLYALAAKHLKPHEVVTEFSLSVQTSKGGQKYSVVKFKMLGKLDPEQAKVAAYFSESIHAAAVKASEITGEDYNRGESANVDISEANIEVK